MKTKSQSSARPVLRWPGGKSRQLKYILPLIPKHTTYVEPFAGGLAVLLAKERNHNEIVNDMNGDLVALYRNLQHHLPALMGELEFMLNARKDFDDFASQPGLTEIQRAARFIMRNKLSFSGGMRTFAVKRSEKGGTVPSREGTLNLLREANRRMDRVIVENLPYEECMGRYDSPQTFYFIDPPYLDANPGAYKGWTRDQMSAFRERMETVKGTWVITIDDSKFNRDLFKSCRIRTIRLRNGCVNTGRVGNRTFDELIITPK